MRLYEIIFSFIFVLLLIGLLIFILSRRDGGDGELERWAQMKERQEDNDVPLGIG